MNIKMKRKLVSVLTLLFMAMAFFSSVAMAEDVDQVFWGGKQGEFEERVPLNPDTDPRALAASIINVILSFLGIIALLIILWGGFSWMTSLGNDTKIGDAKKMIYAGVIGLIIVLTSFAISQFVLREVYQATL